MYGALDAYMGEFKPGLVELDVLADLFSGDENNRPQVTQFVGLLKRLCRKTNEDSEPNKNFRTFEGKKANYSEVGGKFDVEWKDGLFRRVIGPTGFDKMASDQKAEDLFLSQLKRFTEEGRRVSSSAGQNFAPAMFSSEPSTKKLLRLAMERLFEKKIIRVETSGPASRPINSPDGRRVSGTIRRIASRHYSAEGLLRVCRRLQLDLMGTQAAFASK